MSVIILAVDCSSREDDVAVAEINGGRRGVVFQGDHCEAINVLDTRLNELEYRGHQITIGCSQPQPSLMVMATKLRSLSRYYGIRTALQASARGYYSDEFLQHAELWTLPSEIGLPSDTQENRVNDAMRHALLTLSRNHPEHFESLMAYARTREAMS